MYANSVIQIMRVLSLRTGNNTACVLLITVEAYCAEVVRHQHEVCHNVGSLPPSGVQVKDNEQVISVMTYFLLATLYALLSLFCIYHPFM